MPHAPPRPTVPTPRTMARTPHKKLNLKVHDLRWGSPLPAALCCWDYASGRWQGCCTRPCLCACVNSFDPFDSTAHTAIYLAEHPQNDARMASFLGACVATLGRGVAGALLRRGVYDKLFDHKKHRESELASYIYGSWCMPCSQIQVTSVALAVYRRNHPDSVGEVGCCTVDGVSYGPLQDWYYTLQAEGVPGWQCCRCCCCPTVVFAD